MKDLKELLESIDKQSYQNIEVVIVVERSETIAAFANQFSIRYPKKVYFSNEKLGVSNARNVGANLSQGDLIAFVDDDAVLSPNWSDSLVESFRDYPRAIGVTGKAVPLPMSASLRGFPRSLYWAIGCTLPSYTRLRYTNFASGVNMAFKREAFETHRFMLNIVGDSRSRALVYKGLPNDENDFAVRLTTDLCRPILFNPRLIVFHKVDSERTNAKFVSQYSFWQGFAEARYRSNEEWKNVREGVYGIFLKTLLSDIFSFDGGPKASVQRLRLVFTALAFTFLGYFAFQNRAVLQLGKSLL